MSERIVTNGSNAVGDGDRGEVGAIPERPFSNGSNAVRDGDCG